MTIVLIILCILLLLPFIRIILETLFTIIGYGIGAAMIGGLIFLLIIGAKFLGFLYSLCLIIAFMALIAIYKIKSNGNTWEEAILYSTALFLPLFILWLIPWLITTWVHTPNSNMDAIRGISLITAIICSIIAIPCTFNPPTEDIKACSRFLVTMYCVIPIFLVGISWSKTTAIITVIISVIISVIIFIGYACLQNDETNEE